MKSASRFIPCILAAALASSVHADKVYFKSGDTREGRVESVPGDPTSILLVNSLGSIQVSRDLVTRIEETDDATDYAVIGEQFLDIRSYDRAVQSFQKSLEIDTTNAQARAGMDRARELIEAQKVEARRARVAMNSDLLVESRDLLQQERFEEVERNIQTVLTQSPTEEQKTAASLLQRDLYVAWGLSRLDRLDPETAEVYLERALKIDPDNEAANDALLTVWEQDPSKREKVVEAYRNKLRSNPDDIELNRKLADALLALNRPEEALEPLSRFEDTSAYRVNNYASRHKQAMVEVAHARAGEGNLQGAIDMFESAKGKFDDLDTSPVAYWKYQLRLNELEPDDWAGRAALLSYLTENGMTALAAQEAEVILRNDPENETATNLLRAKAEADITDIMEVFNRGQFALAKGMSESFAEENTRFPDLVQRASDIYARADLEAERQAKALREQAREVVAQGDEYLALARRNLELHKSAEDVNRSSIIVYKREAEKYCRRAIQAFEAALEIDPSLGPLVGGMDVNSKLADARQLLSQINRPTVEIFVPGAD